MNKKSTINIAFDPFVPTDTPKNIGSRDDFRLFIKSLQDDNKVNFQFFIITESTNSEATLAQAAIFNVPTANTYYATSQSDKFNKVVSLGIDIHFDGDISRVNYITVNASPALNSSSFPSHNALYVSWLKDNNGLMNYIKKFRTILATLEGETL